MRGVVFCIEIMIFWISILPVFAQSQNIPQNQYKFRYLAIDQGLSNNEVASICQDSRGFMWFGTENGLNKFDGQTIVVYKYDANDSTTLSSSAINSIFLDSRNNLWIGGTGGLNHYHADYDNFIRFKHKDITWSIGDTWCIDEDKNANLWFGGVTGLYRYNLNTNEIKYFSNKSGNPDGIPAGIIYKMLIDRNNKVWVSIGGEGLYLLNQVDSSYTVYRYDQDNETTISSNSIESFYEDSYGNIWIGTWNSGLNRYNPESNSFRRYIPDPANPYSTRVRTMFEDFKGNFFIGTRAGLYLFDKKTNEFIQYANEDHSFSRLSQNSVVTSFIDKSATLWLGTFSGGVNYTSLKRKEFIHYSAGKGSNQYLNGSNIYAITEDKKGNLWIGGDNGLNYLDRTISTCSYYQNNPADPYSLSYNDIKDFQWDNKGNLWIATNRGGLNYYNIKTGRFKAFKHDPDDPHSIASDKVFCIMNDKYNNLWILTSPGNFVSYRNIDVLPNGSDRFIHLNEVSWYGIDQNDNGDVYIGGVNGFWIFTRKDSVFQFVTKENYNGRTNTIKRDSHGRLWIGSDKGLVRYDAEDKSFIWYSEATGYPITVVFGILEDDSNNLWVSTISGLLKIENIVQDTSNIKIRIFSRYDGLQSNQFNLNAYYKSKSGEMMFGGVNGINTFFPDKIIENRVPAEVVITDLKIFNKKVPIGKNIDGRVILEKSISVTDEITLGPRHKIFSLEFASLQNANPDKYIYKIKLQGLEKEWQLRKAGNNVVTYTNLAPGKYSFLISASNNDGFWNEEPVRLKINVLPFFYNTWLFRIIMILGFIGLTIAIYFYRLRSIRNKNLRLERTVKKRTLEVLEKNKMLQEANILLQEKQAEIITQNEELENHRKNLTELVQERTSKLEKALEKARESEYLKSTFLSNMSHEIRTPMNAIMGFSSLLNEADYTNDERAEFINHIQNNGTSLLKIIDGILDLSIIESKQLKIHKAIFEFNEIFDHIYSYYYLNNQNSKIKIKKNNTIQDLNIKLNTDSERIKQIIHNLMDNAFKFTEEGFIELGAYKEKARLFIYVKDTGIGISPDNIDKIFQQFTKVEDDDSKWTRGIGLGLAISYEIAKALGGEIVVESKVGKGSTFALSLPLESILTEEEIVVKEHKVSIPERWEGKVIMIAEDVEANYLYLEKVLKNTKVKIIWAKDGEEAIQMAKDNPDIDLILMDIKMPKVSGSDAAREIKKHNPDQIIVAQTAYARAHEKDNFFDENFDEYLSKPIDPVDMLIALERFL